MATSAVIAGDGGSTYYAVGNVNGKLEANSTPFRPILSPGLRDALEDHPSADVWGNSIMYWSPYGAELRSCVKHEGGALGFNAFLASRFQPFAKETVFPPWPEPQDGGSGTKPASPSGLETLAKNVGQIILDHARQNATELMNPFGAAFDKLGTLFNDPNEFIKSSPLMRLADAFDKALRGDTPQSSQGSGGKEVWKLPNEFLDQDGPFGPNEIYTPRDGGNQPSGPVPGSDFEEKDQTLDRLVDTISDLISKFQGTPDDQRQPGSSIFDKLLPLLGLFGGVDDVISKALDIAKQVPEVLESTGDMLDFIGTFLGPLLDSMGKSRNSEAENKKNKKDAAPTIDLDFDLDPLVDALTAEDQPLDRIADFFEDSEVSGFIVNQPGLVRLGSLAFELNEWV